MNRTVLLTTASVLSLLFLTLHTSDDIARGYEKGEPFNLSLILIVATVLYGALVLTGRRSGYVIVLLGSLLCMLVACIHFFNTGGVAGGRVAGSSGVVFWVWTQFALGACATFAFILSAQALWRSFRPRTESSVPSAAATR